jgi:hypothetical protein
MWLEGQFPEASPAVAVASTSGNILRPLVPPRRVTQISERIFPLRNDSLAAASTSICDITP